MATIPRYFGKSGPHFQPLANMSRHEARQPYRRSHVITKAVDESFAFFCVLPCSSTCFRFYVTWNAIAEPGVASFARVSLATAMSSNKRTLPRTYPPSRRLRRRTTYLTHNWYPISYIRLLAVRIVIGRCKPLKPLTPDSLLGINHSNMSVPQMGLEMGLASC